MPSSSVHFVRTHNDRRCVVIASNPRTSENRRSSRVVVLPLYTDGGEAWSLGRGFHRVSRLTKTGPFPRRRVMKTAVPSDVRTVSAKTGVVYCSDERRTRTELYFVSVFFKSPHSHVKRTCRDDHRSFIVYFSQSRVPPYRTRRNARYMYTNAPNSNARSTTRLQTEFLYANRIPAGVCNSVCRLLGRALHIEMDVRVFDTCREKPPSSSSCLKRAEKIRRSRSLPSSFFPPATVRDRRQQFFSLVSSKHYDGRWLIRLSLGRLSRPNDRRGPCLFRNT